MASAIGHRAAIEEIPEGLSLEELHDHEQAAVLLAHVVDVHHVGVTDASGGARLLDEATFGGELVAAGGLEPLDRDTACP